MKKVIVTGATSMVGAALVNACLQQNVGVLAIVRPHTKRLSRLPKSPLLQIQELDLCDLQNISEIKETYDVFYHFAWSHTAKGERNNPLLQNENIQTTLAAVELAHILGCKKFIGAGSQAEYGPAEGAISPQTAVNPLTAYGIAKYAAGKLSTLLCTSYGICHIWARIFSVYGINDNDGTLIRYAVEKLMCGEKTAFTKGEQAWDYLYEADAGEAFYLLGEKAKENKVYCLGSGIARPLKEYIMEIRNLAAPQAVLGLGEISSLNAQPMSLQADISQLTKDTGFHPRVPFQEGITEIIQNWFPTHPVQPRR